LRHLKPSHDETQSKIICLSGNKNAATKMWPQTICYKKFSPKGNFHQPGVLTSPGTEPVRKKYRPHISFSVFKMVMKMMMVGFHFDTLLKIYNSIIIQNVENNKSNFQ